MVATCAVSAMVGDHADVVRNGITGYLIEGNDQAAFVSALSNLIEHDQLRRTLGENARSAILHGYTIEDGARGWHTALHSTICYS